MLAKFCTIAFATALALCGPTTLWAQDTDESAEAPLEEDLDLPQFEEDVDRAQSRPDITSLFDQSHLETDEANLYGTWSKPARWPLVAIHSALLPNGDVLTYGTNEFADGGQGFIYDRWNPDGGLTPSSHNTLDVQTSNNLFCSAQALVAGTGGLMLVTGGSVERPNGKRNFGVKSVNVYDPVDDSFYMPLDDMFRARWYPTVTQLADGRLLVHGGRNEKKKPTTVPEIFDPATGTWKLMTGAKSNPAYKVAGWNYPRSFMAPNGKVLVMPVGQKHMYYMTTSGRGTMTKIGSLPQKTAPSNHMDVMYDRGKVLSIRKRDARMLTLHANNDVVEVGNAGNIHSHRYWADATLLANGEVMVHGGASVLQSLNHAVKVVELWNPETNSWRLAAPSRKSRLYHSTSLLLPNGTVLCAGGGPPGPTSNLNAEVYYPNYLFTESGSWRKRPRLLGEVANGGSVINI
ncbi:MAG: kelch repeat-containing protein, partial [Planctomycetaceae bacterium]